MFRFLVSLSLLWFLFSCAHQSTPTGGPQDETPPKLVFSIPQNRAVNYRGLLIRLEFDEFIAINNPSQEILIIPTVGKDIKYKVKQKALIIEPKQAWADSTTYSISIREGVRDITENNPPENLKLSFSSGPYIDSLFIVGQVHFARLSEFPKDQKVTVAIHRSDTFNIFEDTPYYFTESDDEGRFNIENIKGGVYYIYALNDKNKNLKVESKTESYGFLADSILVSSQSADSLKIPLISLDARELKINSINNNGLTTTVIMNKPILKYQLLHTYDSTVIHSFGDSRSEVTVYNPQNIVDSVQFTFHAEDNIDMETDTIFYIKKDSVGKNFVPDDFTVTLGKLEMELDSGRISTKITLSKPLKSINYDSLFIPIDSTRKISFSGADVTYDTLVKELFISKKLLKYMKEDSLFERAKKPSLEFRKGFIMSIENDSSKAENLTIPLINKEEMGTLLVEVESDKPHYVIELLSSKDELIERVRDVEAYSFENLPVQDYTIRVIIDLNNNGEWDAGNIYIRQEPEPIYFYKTIEGKYSFPIRANWELGPFMLNF